MAWFKNLSEMSVYEPNLSRVDIEDSKGFEVILLLSAAVIKDVYFASIKDAFNISDAPRSRHNSNTAKFEAVPSQSPPPPVQSSSSIPSASNAPNQRPALHLQTPSNSGRFPSRTPPTDPRSQWQIDAETARLRQEVEQEERVRQQKEQEELKNVRRMIEEEERVARQQQEKIDRETDRLRRAFEAEQRLMSRSSALQPAPYLPPRHSAPPSTQQPSLTPGGPYGQPTASTSSTSFLGTSNQTVKPKRSSFFGLRGGGEEQSRLLKKPSAIF